MAVTGIDTTDALNSPNTNWTNFKNWNGAYPGWAGRYFDPNNPGSWVDGEGKAVKQTTGGVLNQILPVTPGYIQSVIGGTHADGVTHANTICGKIVERLTNGELGLPPSNKVYVYLDVEASMTLSVDFWSGWATTVNTYLYNGQQPFYPALYCHFTQDGSGKYMPDSSIQSVLNQATSKYPSDLNLCVGFWTTQPQLPFPTYCTSNPTLDWTLFGTYSQPYGSNSFVVPVLVWQFAATDVQGCTGNNYPIAGGNNFDLDGINNNASSYMLAIK